MIYFEVYDPEHEFFVEFAVKFSAKNLTAICRMRNSRNITIV